ncbi:MAG: P1 family peptidase [Dehalococcoidia bacterium]
MSNGITDIPGITVGHWTDRKAITGCTAILCPRGSLGGVSVRGASPGTRETDVLNPINRVEEVHAIMLSGGSAYGLGVADGAMRYLEENGIGVKVGDSVVPIVPSAILFDLGIGDSKVRPNAENGYHACKYASGDPVEQGSIGAGTGATVAKTQGTQKAVKGGLGSASIDLGDGLLVGAIVAVNAIGSVYDPENGLLLAGPRIDGIMSNSMDDLISGNSFKLPDINANTTIGVVATNARLTKAQAKRLASSAQDGLALAIRPSHLIGDGDTMFSISTGEQGNIDAFSDMNRIIAGAIQAVANSIKNAIQFAETMGGVPAVRDL